MAFFVCRLSFAARLDVLHHTAYIHQWAHPIMSQRARDSLNLSVIMVSIFLYILSLVLHVVVRMRYSRTERTHDACS